MVSPLWSQHQKADTGTPSAIWPAGQVLSASCGFSWETRPPRIRLKNNQGGVMTSVSGLHIHTLTCAHIPVHMWACLHACITHMYMKKKNLSLCSSVFLSNLNIYILYIFGQIIDFMLIIYIMRTHFYQIIIYIIELIISQADFVFFPKLICFSHPFLICFGIILWLPTFVIILTLI